MAAACAAPLTASAQQGAGAGAAAAGAADDTACPMPLSQHHRQMALNLLELLDDNNDGTLTFSEVLKLTDMTEPQWSDGRRREKARRLLVAMDADADGLVTQEEFLTYVQHQYETHAERHHLFSVCGHLDELHKLMDGEAQAERRATSIVQHHEISHIATLVNAVVDLEFFNESEEQEIFEDAVAEVLRVLDSVLPHPYKKLVVAASDASGLPDREAEDLKQRLEAHIEANLRLPCLEEPEERRVRMAVVEIIVE